MSDLSKKSNTCYQIYMSLSVEPGTIKFLALNKSPYNTSYSNPDPSEALFGVVPVIVRVGFEFDPKFDKFLIIFNLFNN